MEFKTLEDRMLYYRGFTNYKLPSKSYVLAMLDGRKFSSYTKSLNKPFDEGFIDDMNETAKYLCQNISGCKFAFVQSDEISLFISDYENDKTQSWFDYRLNKMLSLAASMASSKFNQLRLIRALKEQKSEGFYDENGDCYKQLRNGIEVDKDRTIIDDILEPKLAEFDAKFWTVPTRNDVFSWFLFRQNDCTRNSISMAAQTYFSHNQLMKKNTDQMQEMLFQEKNINWNNYPTGQKRGRLIVKKEFRDVADFTKVRLNGTKTQMSDGGVVVRNRWVAEDAPLMNSEEGKEYMLSLIPKNE